MKLNEWRRGREFERELPSGLTVTLRRVTLVDLASRGEIPTPLVGMVDEMIGGDGLNVVKVEDFQRFGEAINLVVLAAVKAPAIALVADDEHLGLDELPFDDRVFIFNEMHGPSEQLRPFRSEQIGAVAVGAGGEGVRAEAEQDAGGEGRVGGVSTGHGGDDGGEEGGKGAGEWGECGGGVGEDREGG